MKTNIKTKLKIKTSHNEFDMWHKEIKCKLVKKEWGEGGIKPNNGNLIWLVCIL